MTTPIEAITFPVFDQEVLEKQITSLRKRTASADIKTRSQIQLESMEQRASILHEEGKHMRVEIARLEHNLKELEEILALMRVNERDVAVELAAVLTAIDKLRQSGITL